jgi:hypothetical protein
MRLAELRAKLTCRARSVGQEMRRVLRRLFLPADRGIQRPEFFPPTSHIREAIHLGSW